MLLHVHVQVQPDWLFISTWNELLAQPQVPVVPPYKSMGLESDNSSSYYTFVGELSRVYGQTPPARCCPVSIPSELFASLAFTSRPLIAAEGKTTCNAAPICWIFMLRQL